MNKEDSLTSEEAFVLGVQNHKKNNLREAENFYKKTIKKNPNHIDAYINLGVIFKQLREIQKAKDCFDKAIKIKPNHVVALSNLGIVFKQLGRYKEAKNYFDKAIEINPNNAILHNNLGIVFEELGELKKAKNSFKKSIEINPNYTNAYWNLHTTVSSIDEAISILTKLYNIDNKHTNAKIMISALKGFKGSFKEFDNLKDKADSTHPYTRAIKWVFSLPKLPKIFFNRWEFLDEVISLASKSRPFYEFGVWNGASFKYFIKKFKKGFGFDTFTGLPEAWHDSQPIGSYSSFGLVPKIKGGKFIVGEFKDTLPKFFSKKRPLASVINFDADLYSSTICALNYSHKSIDKKTILVFDEFIMHKNWEKDEYKALNDFCKNLGFSYEVLAISFTTCQVAVKLKKNKID